MKEVAEKGTKLRNCTGVLRQEKEVWQGAWKGMLGISFRISSSLSQGHSCRNLKKVVKGRVFTQYSFKYEWIYR
jgi:hypothetical protein